MILTTLASALTGIIYVVSLAVNGLGEPPGADVCRFVSHGKGIPRGYVVMTLNDYVSNSEVCIDA